MSVLDYLFCRTELQHRYTRCLNLRYDIAIISVIALILFYAVCPIKAENKEPKRIYSTLYDSAENPNRDRYSVTPPSWKTFENRTQFICLRSFPDNREQAEKLIDKYQKHHLGRVIWPVWGTIYYKNLGEIADVIKAKNLYLFDFWGYVPGCGPYKPGTDQSWIQFRVDPVQCKLLEDKLGDHWLGMDNGEQDGRYIGAFSGQQFPISDNPIDPYLQFQRHFEQLGDNLGNRLATLVSLNFGHYYLKEGIYTTIGAETAQALPNSQVYYSWIRGAGKQYGVLWFGNASIFNRWGWKVYPDASKDGRNGPTKGTSLSLLKRLMYSQILYNSSMVGYENGWFIGEDLGPIGKIQQAANVWLDKNGMPGTMMTPVGLLCDFYCGWSFPRHLYTGHSYRVWGSIPYGPGDYLTNNVTGMIYPGYQDSSYFHNEYGFMTPTPYSDSADNLLSDAPLWLLVRYPLLIAAGNLKGRMETKDKLTEYVRQGGRLVITADNIRQFGEFAGITTGAKITLSKNLPIVFANGGKYTEDRTYELFLLNLPKDSHSLAKCSTTTVAAEVPFGKGKIIVLASPYGLAKERSVTGVISNKEDEHLVNPWPMLRHVREVLHQELDRTILFTAGEGLGTVVCRKEKGVYTIGVFNNELKELPMKIESRIGKITSIRELPIDISERSAAGFLPEGFENSNCGKHTDKTMAGADVRVFEVRVDEKGTEEIGYNKPVPRPKDRFLRLAGIQSVKEQILSRPTFFEHYDGVVLDWKYFHLRTAEIIRQESSWIKRQKLRVVVDFTSGMNLFPDLRIVRNDIPEYEKSLRIIGEVIGKAAVLGAKDIIIRGHKTPETSYSGSQALADMREAFKKISEIAKKNGMNMTLRVGEFFPRNVAEIRQTRQTATGDNVRFSLPLGTVDSYFGDEAIAGGLDKLSFIMLGGIREDENNGGKWTGNAPLHSSSAMEKSYAALAKFKNVPFIFDIAYENQDDEYQDVRFLQNQMNREKEK